MVEYAGGSRSLFEAARRSSTPLAERLRPDQLADVGGHEALVAPGTMLGDALRGGRVPSLVLWGPPGTGKTTLARILATRAEMAFAPLSAVTSGVKDVRQVIAQAKERARLGTGTLLFVDEVHRFNRAQQDAFLPHVEDGTVTLVGATTENPSFALIRALLSRLRVVVLEPIPKQALAAILARALTHPSAEWGRSVDLDPEARGLLLEVAGGDARRLLNILESAFHLAAGTTAGDTTLDITAQHVQEAAQTRMRGYDRHGDGRYDLLSAFHKSLRGSDVDAALYWMARMLEGGEDPLVIVRRMVAMAAEDIGLADPTALRMALDAKEAVHFLGQPEGELPLVQAVLHLATAPKSNSVARSLAAAKAAAREHPDEAVPIHLRNAPTPLAKSQGHGADYRYPHDDPRGFSEQRHAPEAVEGTRLYQPKEIGEERETARRLAYWRRLRGDQTP
jgi:putative ATPase